MSTNSAKLNRNELSRPLPHLENLHYIVQFGRVRSVVDRHLDGVIISISNHVEKWAFLRLFAGEKLQIDDRLL